MNSKCLNSNTICPSGQTACSETSCADLTSDNMNCGSCGNVCPAYSKCTDSACAGMEDINSLGCTQGQIECNGQCVDDTSDNNNCGDCGRVCPAGSQCSNSQCWIPATPSAPTAHMYHQQPGISTPGSTGPSGSTSGTTCGTGLTECNGKCVDTAIDNANCGGCLLSCPSGQTCSEGKCVQCQSDETTCYAVSTGTSKFGTSWCANFQTDPNNCGGCGHGCEAGEEENGNPSAICVGGTCTCPSGSGLTWCEGLDECYNLQTDNYHCGACKR